MQSVYYSIVLGSCFHTYNGSASEKLGYRSGSCIYWNMLEVNRVSKKFNARQVLNGLSFQLQPGEITTLIGGNGSGKTTTFRLILNFLDPDEGSIRFEDRPVENCDVCYLCEQRSLYQDCSVYDQLRLSAQLSGIRHYRPVIDRWLDELRLSPLKQEIIGRLSKGNQQKVALASSLIKDAPLVIMDEPFTALDRENIALFIRIMENLRSQGKTVLVSSHIYQPVKEICDHYLLLDKGRISVDLTRKQLHDDARRMIVVSSLFEPEEESLLAEEQNEEGENVRYVFTDRKKARRMLKEAFEKDEDVTYRHCRIEDFQ